MTTRLSDLMAELSPRGRREVEARARVHLRAMEDAERLDQVRKAANKTQGEIARLMGIGQNAVSQLESRNDLQLSTLHRYVSSLGLRLELAVVAESGERAVLRNYQPWRAMEQAAAKEPLAAYAGRKAAPRKKPDRDTASAATGDRAAPAVKRAAKKRSG